MKVSVDTSAVLRYADVDDPAHAKVVFAIPALWARGVKLGHTPQTRREFWNVATRPRQNNGLGWEPSTTDALLSAIEQVIPLWDDAPGIASQWRRLVTALDVRGVQVHDANHAAAALFHGATHVLTLDRKDFERFRRFGLEPLSPEDV